MRNKRISIIVPTYNGADTIGQVLDAYASLGAPSGGYELIIVNNNSDDETHDIVQKHICKLRIIYKFEGRKGKTIALNKALDIATGDLVVLTDDDAVPRPDWLVRLASCAEEHEEFAVFAGKIEPRWPATPPQWLLTQVPLGPAYAVTPPMLKSGPVSPGFVWGPNMMIRRSVIDAGFRFDEGVGPKGKKYGMGDETEFTRRLARSG